MEALQSRTSTLPGPASLYLRQVETGFTPKLIIEHRYSHRLVNPSTLILHPNDVRHIIRTSALHAVRVGVCTSRVHGNRSEPRF